MKTDNSHFEAKVQLRLQVVAETGKDTVTVLELFAGKSLLWSEVKKRTDVNIRMLSIEKERGKNPLALGGDNMKFLPSLDLSQFDIIDIDAYGSCFNQLNYILEQDYAGYIICTDIQSMFGRTSDQLLERSGFTRAMIKKIPTLINAHANEALWAYLADYGYEHATGFFLGRKKYFYIKKNSA